MGVSASGERGIRARTVPLLLISLTVIFSVVYYVVGPPITPGLVDAAEQKCNEYAGNDFRSYRLEWKTVGIPDFEWPHWSCQDVKKLGQEPVNFGWWVSPF